MILDKSIKNKIRLHALKESPRECCGLIILTGNGFVVHETNNSSLLPNFFRVDPVDYLRASDKGKIVAAYHSHTNDNESFSEFDKFNSINHGLTYILYSLKNNALTQFSPEYSTFNAYVGRKFEIGKTDCFSLVKDFYFYELGIELLEYHRDGNWRSYLSELFDKHYENDGFTEVNDYKKYDCILFRSRKNKPSSHISIYLGDDLILHQPFRSYSRIETLTDKHKKLISKVIRHRSCQS